MDKLGTVRLNAARLPQGAQQNDCAWIQGCQKVRGSNPAEPIEVSVLLKPTKNVEPKPFQAAASADLAATPSQIESVRKFAEANGLTVGKVYAETRTVKLEGTPAQYRKAFGVDLAEYRRRDGGTFRGYEGHLKMPAALGDNVEAVLGFDNHPIVEPQIRRSPRGLFQTYTPPQVARCYHFPGKTGQGQTIGIIELGGGYKDSDLQQYFSELGIKKPNVTAVGVDGANNAPTGSANGPDGEVALDIDVIGAIAPGANIRVYFAPNTEQGFVDAINQAAKECNVESISWGAPEDQWSADGKKGMNAALHNAASRGVNAFAASGDRGSADGEKGNHTDFPASSAWAIGTGGTKMKSNNGQITSETAWNDWFLGKGGGGISSEVPKPDFQQNLNIPRRGVPDVAGNASTLTGYIVRVDGQEAPVGGTSAVAPLYAALTAQLGEATGKPLGWLNPFFYQHPEAFNDITSGNNGGFSAGPGWDAVTGLGSPDGQKLLSALQQAHAQAS
ncbi:MAG: S53 family peptidase [Candidatus Xenobia bacterium]